MTRIVSLIGLIAILLVAVPSAPVAAQVTTPPDSVICTASGGSYGPDGAGSNYCLWTPPAGWNGDLVIYAHGYVDPLVPAGMIPWDQIVLDAAATPPLTLPQVLVGMNYAFAITSYSKNGLAVNEGIQAVNQLAALFKAGHPQGHIFLVGASEGGLVTAKAIEQTSNNLFNGGVTTCGPIGDFTKQVNYWGDFRVLFDYFFPGFKTALGSPIDISPATRLAWGQLVTPPAIPDPTSLQGQISQALAANPNATAQLMSTSKAPFDSSNKAATIDLTVRGLLDYNVKATNDGHATLGGQPFDNNPRWYFGSANDWLLNVKVARFDADPAAVHAMQSSYQTTGRIQAPLVAMHTTGDPIVPYWHELLYLLKVWGAGKGSQFFTIPIVRYGHCAFTPKEAIFAFAVMVYKATGALPLALLSPQADNPHQVLTLQDYQTMIAEAEKNSQTFGPSKVFVPMLTK